MFDLSYGKLALLESKIGHTISSYFGYKKPCYIHTPFELAPCLHIKVVYDEEWVGWLSARELII